MLTRRVLLLAWAFDGGALDVLATEYLYKDSGNDSLRHDDLRR